MNKEKLDTAANLIEQILPNEWGYLLVMFPLKRKLTDKGAFHTISNLNRKDMVDMLSVLVDTVSKTKTHANN